MVARTPSLGSLKNGLKQSIIFPRIHHPLPLSRRESQQLLNSITSSFRKNLDKEHPWQPSDATGPASTSNSEQSPSTAMKDVAQSHRPTDRHLESILSNPLFAQPHAVTQETSNALQNHHDFFESAVAKGLMTPRGAAGYLAAIHKDLKQSALDIPAGMAASGSGLRVVQWLRASGAENSLEFLHDHHLPPLLVRFVFAEGLEEVAWMWLSRLAAQLGALPKDAQMQQSLAHLLYVIKDAQAYMSTSTGLAQTSLDAGYSTFLRATRTVPSEDPVALKSLQRYWRSLSWSSTVDASLYQSPSAPLYEMFVDVGRPWKKHQDLAHLELHHPTHPDHASAVKYLHNDRVQETAARLKNSEQYVNRMVSLGADTVHRLNQVGENSEASWVSEFMSRTFFAWNVRPSRDDPPRLKIST
jgi:hypothetical protein